MLHVAPLIGALKKLLYIVVAVLQSTSNSTAGPFANPTKHSFFSPPAVREGTANHSVIRRAPARHRARFRREQDDNMSDRNLLRYDEQ